MHSCASALPSASAVKPQPDVALVAPIPRTTTSRKALRSALKAGGLAVLLGAGVWALPADWSDHARLSLLMFGLAMIAWTLLDADDTAVAIAAALALVVTGGVSVERFHQSLGDSLIWLLLGAFVLAAGEGWHPGVIGIVASRLAERFHAPAAVVALDRGKGRGSGRSVAGFDLGAAVIAARQAGLLLDGGGHRQAAGFSLEQGRLDALRSFLGARAAEALGSAERAAQRALLVDAVLGARGATADFVDLLDRAGPYGAGHPQPCFALSDMRVVQADIVGEKHVRCVLADSFGARVRAIAFRAVDTPLAPLLLDRGGPPVHVAGQLRADSWNGMRRTQFEIRDAATARQP